MLKLTIKIEGKTFADLELALAEVNKKVKEEYGSGFDSNEDGSYSFDITGDEEGEPESESEETD